MQLSHYSKLNDNVRETRWIDYNELMGLLKTVPVGPSLPKDFFDRFRNIQAIRVSEPPNDQDHLALFVRNCKRLVFLSISNSQLSQTFFDQLPAISSLRILELNETKCLNTDFIVRMSRLTVLQTNQQLRLKVATNMVRARCQSFVQCKIGYELVKIARTLTNDQYSFERKGNLLEELNYEDLVEHCDLLEENGFFSQCQSIQ